MTHLSLSRYLWALLATGMREARDSITQESSGVSCVLDHVESLQNSTVPRWLCTSCTGAMLSLAQSVSVAQHNACPAFWMHTGPVLKHGFYFYMIHSTLRHPKFGLLISLCLLKIECPFHWNWFFKCMETCKERVDSHFCRWYQKQTTWEFIL